MTDHSPTAPMPRRAALLGGVASLLATPGWAAHHHRPAAAAPAAPPAAADAAVATPAATPLGPVDTVAREACIVDFDTGASLLDKQADTPMTPSSLTKLMTAYLVFAALAAGKITLTQQFPVSEAAWRMGGSKMFVPYPGSVAVQDLIRGMIIQSGNDACIVLAEGISGSQGQFIDRMNQMAGTLGLKNSVFKNCTGWPDPGHVMSARDIATLAARLIGDFPQYYHFFSETSFVFNGISQGNRNTLVDRGLADGLKTGHTEEGGYGECSSAKRDGRRVIVVLNGMNSMHERARETERMLDWAFASFENVQLLTAGEVIDHIPVWLGTAPEVSLIGSQTVRLTWPRGWQHKTRITVAYDTPARAPIAKGEALGRMVVSVAGAPDMIWPLLAADSVARLKLPERAARVMSYYLTGT